MKAQTMLWRRLDRPGHDAARLVSRGSSWELSGTAVFAFERRPCRLDYLVECDAEWRTVRGRVSGWIGSEIVEFECAAAADRRWRRDGREHPGVEGCLDLDLHFSPSTNLLPIRRLGLAVGEEARMRAAWLHFPSFDLDPLEQVYRRIAPDLYRFEAAYGKFVTELRVDDAGFVTDYPDFWQAEPPE